MKYDESNHLLGDGIVQIRIMRSFELILPKGQQGFIDHDVQVKSGHSLIEGNGCSPFMMIKFILSYERIKESQKLVAKIS